MTETLEEMDAAENPPKQGNFSTAPTQEVCGPKPPGFLFTASQKSSQGHFFFERYNEKVTLIITRGGELSPGGC